MAALDLIATLGAPDIPPGRRLSPLRPECRPANKDYEGARELLVHLRTSDPSFKTPDEQKRGFLSRKKKESLSDPDAWSFSNAEVGTAITIALRGNVLGVVGIVAALLAMGRDQGVTAEQLWTCEQDRGQRSGSRLLKLIRPQKPTSIPGTPCPWLEIAVEMDSLALVHLLCRAEPSQSCLDDAFEKAIHIESGHHIAKELVAFGANFSGGPDFFINLRASSHRALQMTELFLSTHHPPRHPTALVAMKMAAKAVPMDKNLQEILSILLANVSITPLEAYGVLLAAIEGQNLSAVAALSLATGHHWSHIVETGGSEATKLAAHIDDDGIRFRLLDFLRLAGATPDTPELRERLLQDAELGNFDHVNLLLLFGVSPATPTTHSDSGTLGWAIRSLNLLVFDLVLAAQLTPEAASAALHHLPELAPENTKMKIVQSMAERGASPEELSRQLLVSVRNSERYLTEMLLRLGATASYRDRDGASALSIASGLRNIPLIRNLCSVGVPSDIVSEAMPHALARPWDHGHDLISVLALLVSNGAHGLPVDETVLIALNRPGPTTEQILMVLLPVGIGPVASGKAAQILARPDRTVRSLELLCGKSVISETALGSALQIVLSNESFNREKARILSETIIAAGQHNIFDDLLVHFHGEAPEKSYDIVNFLLASGASIDSGEGCVMVAEVSRGNLARLGEMMTRHPSPVTLKNTLKASLSLAPSTTRSNMIQLIVDAATTDIGQGTVALRAVQEDDIALLTVVMDPSRGHVPFRCIDALQYAIDHVRDQAVSVFVESNMTPEAATTALDYLLGGRSLEDPQAVTIAASFLKVGVDSKAKDVALRKAFSAVTVSGAFPASVIRLLVSEGANACQQGCLLFRMTSEKADILTLQALIEAPFPLDPVVRALIESADEGSVGYVVEALGICLSETRKPSTARLRDNTLLKAALEKYPESEALVTLLLDNGCRASTNCGLHEDEDVGGRTWNVLPFLWALNPTNRVSDAVTLKLFSATSQPDLSDIPPSTMAQVVYAAAAREEEMLFEQLISRGICIDLEPPDGHTALALATSYGDLLAVERLTNAGSRPNDGSLHIAAAQLDAEAINLLRDSGHDLNWPCPHFQGLIPVIGLISVAEESGPPWQRELEDALESLVPFPEAKCQQGEKSVLHHILDQPLCPVALLRAYARVARLHDQPSKDDDYLFKCPHSKLCYSPTMYVRHCSPAERDRSTKSELVKILKGLSFQDRYYAESGPQPAGYVKETLPQAVKYSLEREQDAEQDRRRLDEQRRRQADESEQRRKRADADDARDRRAMAAWADVEIDIEERRARARLAAKRADRLDEENHEQYLSRMRLSELDERGRLVSAREARSLRFLDSWGRKEKRIQDRIYHQPSPPAPYLPSSTRPLRIESSRPRPKRTSGNASSRSMQMPSSSAYAGYYYPPEQSMQMQPWSGYPGFSYPSGSQSRRMPSSSAHAGSSRQARPTGRVIGPVDEHGYVPGYDY